MATFAQSTNMWEVSLGWSLGGRRRRLPPRVHSLCSPGARRARPQAPITAPAPWPQPKLILDNPEKLQRLVAACMTPRGLLEAASRCALRRPRRAAAWQPCHRAPRCWSRP
jgi:hypothetical protein